MPDHYSLVAILVATFVAFISATLVGDIAVRAGFPLPEGGKKIGCVDGLRGYLALAVLVHHFLIWVQVTRLGAKWEHPKNNLLANFGAGGVALFFMTTGLLFYPRVLKGAQGNSWVALYITRAFRIIPLVAVSVAIVTAIIITRTGARPHLAYLKEAAEWITAWKQPSILDYPDSGRLDAYVLWSLWVEWAFYLAILPACALAQDTIRGRAPTWIVPAALLVIGLTFHQSHMARELPKYLPLFALGMLAWEAQNREWIRRRLQQPAAAVLAIAALLFGLTSAPNPYAWPQAASLGLFFAAVVCGNDFAGVLRTRGALALGECSYGIYLLHGILLDLLFTEGRTMMSGLPPGVDYAVLPLVVIAAVVITPVTYLLVERPMLRLGVRFAKAVTGLRIRSTAPQVEVAP